MINSSKYIKEKGWSFRNHTPLSL